MSNERYNQIIDEVYENYCNQYWGLYSRDRIEHGSSYYNHETNEYEFETYSKEEFIDYIKTNNKFSEKWGLKIEERELSLEERQGILERVSPMYYMDQQFGGEDIFTRNNIPTKLITLTYNSETIESYE